MATTVIAFSGSQGDYILVEGEPSEVKWSLDHAVSAAEGLCELMQLPDPSHGQRFDPAPVFVNPNRVAYIRPPAGKQAAG